eukprot:g9172.t1
MQYKPETNNEARLRDVRAEEEIHRIQQQGQLDQKRTDKTADTRSKTADILAAAASTDANMAAHHNQFKNTRVDELHKKKAKLEKDEEQFRKFIKYSWICLPITLVVYLGSCGSAFLPDMMKEKKRNAQRKIKEADQELYQLTNVNVRSSYSMSNHVNSSDTDRRVSGTMDQPPASVYAAPPARAAVVSHVAPVSHVVTAPPPPSYHEFVGGAVHVQ